MRPATHKQHPITSGKLVLFYSLTPTTWMPEIVTNWNPMLFNFAFILLANFGFILFQYYPVKTYYDYTNN